MLKTAFALATLAGSAALVAALIADPSGTTTAVSSGIGGALTSLGEAITPAIS